MGTIRQSHYGLIRTTGKVLGNVFTHRTDGLVGKYLYVTRKTLYLKETLFSRHERQRQCGAAESRMVFFKEISPHLKTSDFSSLFM